MTGKEQQMIVNKKREAFTNTRYGVRMIIKAQYIERWKVLLPQSCG
jgi:hypothetical protein